MPSASLLKEPGTQDRKMSLVRHTDSYIPKHSGTNVASCFLGILQDKETKGYKSGFWSELL
jgi:hypothetical protein